MTTPITDEQNKEQIVSPEAPSISPVAEAPVVTETPVASVAEPVVVVETSTPVVTPEAKVEDPATETVVKTEEKHEETAKEKEESIQDSVKEGFHKVGDFFGDIGHKVVDFVSHATGKIASTPKSIEEFFTKNEDTFKNVGKWTLYVGTFKRVLDGGIYAGKKTKQQIELTYSNAMENLRQKLSEVDRKTKIETVKKEDISFVGVDGSFFYSDKETGIATNINVETKEGKTISEEEFEKQKALVAK